jgi:hypothetical protein
LLYADNALSETETKKASLFTIVKKMPKNEFNQKDEQSLQ